MEYGKYYRLAIHLQKSSYDDQRQSRYPLEADTTADKKPKKRRLSQEQAWQGPLISRRLSDPWRILGQDNSSVVYPCARPSDAPSGEHEIHQLRLSQRCISCRANFASPPHSERYAAPLVYAVHAPRRLYLKRTV